jgi:hypothetical protein
VYIGRGGSINEYVICIEPDDKGGLIVGIPLAVIYVAAQEADAMFLSLKIYSLSVHPFDTWGDRNEPHDKWYLNKRRMQIMECVFLFVMASAMSAQILFEITVFAKVMATSPALIELIKDFVALAVANQVRACVLMLLFIGML